MELFIVYLLLINAAGLMLMLADKQKARKKRHRVPEASFFSVALCGGSLGVYVGMHLAHHKTRHKRFTVFIPILLVVQAILVVWLLPQLPRWTLSFLA